jgi:tetratricopeptide (TPR) repeat protein
MTFRQSFKTTIVLALSVSVFTLSANSAFARSKFEGATVDPADQNLKQGLLMIRKGNYEGAIDSFKQAIYFSRNQYNPEAQKLLSLSYKATRNYPKAIETALIYFKQNTDADSDMRVELAECYMDIHEWDKARQEVENAVRESKGSNWRYRFAQGELQEKLADSSKEGSYSEAIDFYNGALDLKKHCTEAWMGIARCDVKLNRHIDALKQYREILSQGPLLRPNLEELYYNMGTCFLKRGDHQGALDHWRLALESNPESFDTHLALARLLDDEKHYSSALKEYEAAMRCQRNQDSLDNRKIARRIQWIEQQIQPQEAPVEIKPSPQMRQQVEQEQQRAQDAQNAAAPPRKDSGF